MTCHSCVFLEVLVYNQCEGTLIFSHVYNKLTGNCVWFVDFVVCKEGNRILGLDLECFNV